MTTPERLQKAEQDAHAGVYDATNHVVRGIGKTAAPTDPELLRALTILGIKRRVELYEEQRDSDYGFTSYLDPRSSATYYVATSWSACEANGGALLTVIAHEDDWHDAEMLLQARDVAALLQMPGDRALCVGER